MRIITLKIVATLIATIAFMCLFVVGVYTLELVSYPPASQTDILLLYTAILLVILLIGLGVLHSVPDEDYHHNP